MPMNVYATDLVHLSAEAATHWRFAGCQGCRTADASQAAGPYSTRIWLGADYTAQGAWAVGVGPYYVYYVSGPCSCTTYDRLRRWRVRIQSRYTSLLAKGPTILPITTGLPADTYIYCCCCPRATATTTSTKPPWKAGRRLDPS